MIADLLNAGGGDAEDFTYANDTSVSAVNGTEMVGGNLTESRSMGGGMRRAGAFKDWNGDPNGWWEDIVPTQTYRAFKKCCELKGTMDEACTRMCDWEYSEFVATFV